ncbi:hypothetical protein DV736_g2732, partial [Chaetothyriales sp. CBS 134916]
MAAKATKKSSSKATFSVRARKTSSASAAAATGATSKSKYKISRSPPKQQKSKPGQQTSTTPRKRKVRTYTDKELNLPAFNGIVPAGVTQSSGKKKGKVFIDDGDEMMTILNLVRAEKDGQIESKVAKMRQLEEIRESRKREMESRAVEKAKKMEEAKKRVKAEEKRKRKRVEVDKESAKRQDNRVDKVTSGSTKKRVRFA